MNLEEYREWLRENGNLEEANALGVVDVIVRHHTYGRKLRLKELYPHVWLKDPEDDLNVEFDLIIELESWTEIRGHRLTGTRRIGVEFKEGDVKKVLAQAIARRPLVDYIYIATRKWVHLDFDDLFVMGYYGIGWVVWDENFAKMIVESRWHRPHKSIEYMVERAIKLHLEKVMRKLEQAPRQEKSLLEYLGV